jgi:hypothetical protein
MRNTAMILGLMAMAAVSAIATAPAQAGYDYPVCMKVYGDPTYDECQYTSVAQCNATASGRAAQCYVNPFFASAAPPSGRRQHRYGSY